MVLARAWILSIPISWLKLNLRGMISHPNHHHQDVPGGIPTHIPACTASLSFTLPTDQLLGHHKHLESFLDSALATLTLIIATTTSLPFTLHVTQVTEALARYITIHSAPAPVAPTAPAVPAAPTDDHTWRPTVGATYASVLTNNHDSPSPISPEPSTHKHPTPAPATPRSSAVGRPRVVVRFDLDSSSHPIQVEPLLLYGAIEDALGGKDQALGGVRWTRRGNLVLYPACRIKTAGALTPEKTKIWTAISPLLGLPADYVCPPFDSDDHQNAVVFHDVPVPASRSFSRGGIEAFLDIDGVKVNGFAILCRPEDIEKRTSVPVQVSLSSGTDAQQLVDNGGSFYGAQCRVTHWKPTV
ncbi:hypothetical protein DFH09DRAFT_1085847 [Mycena vulgaris]|nr:hypothetical protein DFH09DRAFT_1085847 [Mycena vulgaris]